MSKKQTLLLQGILKMVSLMFLFFPGLFILRAYNGSFSFNVRNPFSFYDVAVDCVTMDTYVQLGYILIVLLIASIVVSLVAYFKEGVAIRRTPLLALDVLVAASYFFLCMWCADATSGSYQYAGEFRRKTLEMGWIYYLEWFFIALSLLLSFSRKE